MKVVVTEQPRYRLPKKPAEDVHLVIDAGQFQGGFARVRLGQQILADGRLPMRVLLGKSSELEDKRVRVRAIISDHSRLTNRVSVAYALTPGPVEENTHGFDDEADEKGGSVEFQTTFRLLAAKEP
jgi:hypothetical protein